MDTLTFTIMLWMARRDENMQICPSTDRSISFQNAHANNYPKVFQV